jgi:hypothetical protein
MKIFMGLFLTGSAFFCFAQKKADPVLFGNSIKSENLRKHLFQIAGPAFEGRETATPGQQKAASYIEDYFRGLGLKPGNNDSYQYPFPVYKDSFISSNIRVNDQEFELNRDYQNSTLSKSYSFSYALSDVVFTGYGLSDSVRDDYQGLNVHGKIVMILGGFPPGYVQVQINKKNFNSFAKINAALKHGAVAVLLIQEDFPRRKPLNDPELMYRDYFKEEISPAFFYISENIARKIMGADYDLAKKGNPESKSYKSDVVLSLQKQTQLLQSTDVLGFLEGSDLKDQILVISAHYDHLGKKDSVIYFGADDDGSGTVSLLELAAAFSKAKEAGKGPRRSILFLANSGEEKGLWGSEFYTNHPLYPMEKTTADLNIDMIGRKDPNRKQGDSNNYVYIVGDDKLSTDLHAISVAINKKYTGLVLDYKFNDPGDPLKIYYRSDHFNFARKGVPIIFYFDGIHADYHMPTDTPDKINYDLMVKRAQLVFYTAWEMANRENMLKRDLPAVTSER